MPELQHSPLIVPTSFESGATAFARSLGHPFVLVEDLSKRVQVVKFIVKMPRAAALKLERKQAKGRLGDGVLSHLLDVEGIVA